MITELDDDLVKNLVRIIVETWAFIILSSSWRNSPTLIERLRDQFYNYSLPDNFSSVDLWGRLIWKTDSYLWHGRGNEVLNYIMSHNENCKWGKHINKWVMVDDDDFDSKCVKRLGHFVHTKTHEGLTDEKTEECIKILWKII